MIYRRGADGNSLESIPDPGALVYQNDHDIFDIRLGEGEGESESESEGEGGRYKTCHARIQSRHDDECDSRFKTDHMTIKHTALW